MPPVEEIVYPAIDVPVTAVSVEDDKVKAGSAKHEAEVATGTTPLGNE